MEDGILKENPKPQKVKAGSASKKDIDKDFNIKNVVHGISEVRRNPKRQVGVKNYVEIDEPQDDRYIYCDFCEKVFVDNCTMCGQLAILQDDKVEMGIENRAKLTVPKTTLVILPSPIHGLGVFARVPLKKGIKMGPYEGKITRLDSSTGYSWKLRDGRLVDAADEKFSNWMRYINCARHVQEQNVVAFQYKGNLYYRTCREIKIGEELLVYYGQSFANILGIDIKNYFKPKEEPMTEHPKICPHCNYGYKDYSRLKDHIVLCKWNPDNIKKVPDKIFTCRFCPLGIADEEYYKKHEKRCEKRQEKIKENLIEGNEAVVSNKRKQRRSTNNNNKIFHCHNCNYSSNNKGSLNIHQGIHGKTFPFSCTVCHKGFNSVNVLKVHMFKHINEASNITIQQKTKTCNGNAIKIEILAEIAGSKFEIVKFECTKCDYTTSEPTNMKRHMNIHTKKSILSCNSCDFNSADLKDLIVHLDELHKNENYTCCKCKGGIFCEKHMRKMSKYEVEHICNICGYITHQRMHLKRHIKSIHLQEKNYKCQFCQLCVNTHSELKVHINAVHLKLKEHKCEQCSYASNQKNHLKIHIKNKHLKLQQLKCSLCEYSTNNKNNLEHHINAIHLKLEKYECTLCKFFTYYKQNLKSHMDAKHFKQ